MHRTPRRITATTLIAGGLLLSASPAYAVVDPVAFAQCVAHSATDVTSLVDPHSPGLPAEPPAVSCLHP
ncbi:hypothetical protein HII36_32770 [Nonomuraea sp. NN258]|uniref:hypothetical protein n=1 Tax=Nonomuraea antri TaxID=2730852 RepID=UPI0015689273|nr:hypothetical protein [Nonomuraea antri]NRQ36572.1 hypothetical protein [Nonomuraea antri]